jgi:hypothetical protein
MFETKINLDQQKVDPPPPYKDVVEPLDVHRSRAPPEASSGNNVTVTSPRTMQLRILEHFDKKVILVGFTRTGRTYFRGIW